MKACLCALVADDHSKLKKAFDLYYSQISVNVQDGEEIVSEDSEEDRKHSDHP